MATECFFERPRAHAAAMRRTLRRVAGLLPARPGHLAARCRGPHPFRPGLAGQWRDNAALVEKRRETRGWRSSAREDVEALFALAVEYLGGSALRPGGANAHPECIELHRPTTARPINSTAPGRGSSSAAAGKDIKDCNRSLAVRRRRSGNLSRPGSGLPRPQTPYEDALDDLDHEIEGGRQRRRRLLSPRPGLGSPGRAPPRGRRLLPGPCQIHPLVAEVYYHSGLANRELGQLDDAETDLAKAFSTRSAGGSAEVKAERFMRGDDRCLPSPSAPPSFPFLSRLKSLRTSG